ncbi:FAD-binding oxidoreductase [Actinomadura xylanilytica]|uniref:FAD-binding oxidoreductase n=1 Tax=Actinomadura xylanilytica TaxID=887459 RepID=UPI00255AFC60|nr:FAD-binding oxidoreductase [Actinomadura xylanilytica]MDL4771416.1 FAD-binding oxidoreductase [Actinomadura xylanilytica]
MRPLDALAEVCGDVRPGAPEEGVLGVVPGLVAAPATAAEAAGVMRVAAEHGLAVVPRGAETRLDWGTPPDRCDLLVDTHRLARIVEHASGDLVVTAEAGLALDELAAALAARGQRLALDRPLPGSTVGGTIAAAAAGPLRLLYGSPRDLVIGLTVVRADGEVARSGGKVVKNVAGYDLGRLFCGSSGTLGLIVEATFRLHPVPAAHAYVTCPVTGAAQAHEAVQSLLHSPIAPSAIEVLAPTPPSCTVGVLLEGVPEGVTARTAQATALLGPDAQVCEEPPEGWGLYPDGTTLLDVTAPPTSLTHLLTEIGADALTATWSAIGRGYVGLPAETAPDKAAAIIAGLREGLARHRGSAVVCYAPADVRAAIDFWGPVPAAKLMRQVKDQFDPGHRLSPGRFVGGI